MKVVPRALKVAALSLLTVGSLLAVSSVGAQAAVTPDNSCSVFIICHDS